MRLIEQYADALYQCLPATDREQIRRRMATRLGRIFTIGLVDATLHYVRTHPDECGYNVCYVKRGVPSIGDENRFFVSNKDDASFQFTDAQRNHVDAGMNSTLSGVQTYLTNAAEMLGTAIVHEPMEVDREYLADMQEIVTFLARRMGRLRTAIAEKRASHAA